MNGFYSKHEANVLSYVKFICGCLSIICSFIIMARFQIRRNFQKLSWKELAFEEIVAFIASTLFCSLIFQLAGGDLPYSTKSLCIGHACLELYMNWMTYLNFCLLTKLSINLFISSNINEISRFSQLTKGLYYGIFAATTGLCSLILVFFTIFYVYFHEKQTYKNENYSNLNHCQKDWAIVWRYVAYIPLFVGLIYPLIKVWCVCKRTKLRRNTDWKKVATSNSLEYLKLQRIAKMNCLYVIVFYLCHIFSAVRRFYNVFGTIDNDNGDKSIVLGVEPSFWVGFVQSVLELSYGFFNFIVYWTIVYVVDYKNKNAVDDCSESAHSANAIEIDDDGDNSE